MNDLIETGVPLFDRNFGGLLSGRPYLAFGDPGTGKSLLGLQFLSAGIARGEPGLLLTLERPEDLLPQAERLGFVLEEPLDDSRLILLEYDQNATGLILRYGWKPFLEKLRPFALEHGVRRAVFDPIHPLFAGNTEEGRMRYDLRYLVESLEEWGWTTLFFNERGATSGHPSFYRVFSDLCSGVFELQDETEELTSTKYLFVHKMRHAAGPRRKIPFQILPPQGLVEIDAPAHAGPGDSASETQTRGGSQSPQPGLGAFPATPFAGPSAQRSFEDPASSHGAGMRVGSPDTRFAGPVPSGASPAGAEGETKKTVLLVDDDPFIRRLLEKSLEAEFRVLQAEDGVSAITTALTEAPDVVVLDVMLPGINGFEVCRALRSSGADVPILLVSGGACDEEDRVRGLFLGANDYISKPFSVRELTGKVRSASRYRVAVPTDVPREELDRVLENARQRFVSGKRFLQLSDQACQDAARYQVPLAAIRLRWEAASLPAEARGQLLAALERLTRPEDILGLAEENGASEAMCLLTAEDAGGVVRYLKRLRGYLLEAAPDHFGTEAAGISASFSVYQPAEGGKWTGRDLLEHAEGNTRDLTGESESVVGEEEEAPRTGTDG